MFYRRRLIIKILNPATNKAPINPIRRGFRPTFLKELKTVFNPIPARPKRIRNLPAVLKACMPSAEKYPWVFSPARRK
jgi:hypothetical protein